MPRLPRSFSVTIKLLSWAFIIVSLFSVVSVAQTDAIDLRFTGCQDQIDAVDQVIHANPTCPGGCQSRRWIENDPVRKVIKYNIQGINLSAGTSCEVYYGDYDTPSNVKVVSSVTQTGTRTPVLACGSVIDVAKKTVRESIPIQGTAFSLIWSSEFSFQREENRKVDASFILQQTSLSPQSIAITDNNNTVATFNLPVSTSIQKDWTWDGITGADISNPILTKGHFVFSLTRSYTVDFLSSPFLFSLVSRPQTVVLYRPEAWGLGGWTLSSLHFFDQESSTLFWGSGFKSQVKVAQTMQLPPYGKVNLVVDPTGSDVYVFDSIGRHVETRSPLTGVLRLRFSYQSDNKLVAVYDQNGKTIQFQRDATGRLLKIVAAFGQTTIIGTDSAGALVTVTDPSGASHSANYDSKQLLSHFTKPDGIQTTFTYSPTGDFVREDKNNGIFQAFVEIVNGLHRDFQKNNIFGLKTLISILKPESNLDSDVVTQTNSSGQLLTQTIEAPTSKVISAPGELVKIQYGNDPRWGAQLQYPSVVSDTVSSEVVDANANPSTNLANISSAANVAAVLSDPLNPFSIQSLTITSTNGSATATSTFDSASMTYTLNDGSGLIQTVYLDSIERITKVRSNNGLTNLDIDYNSDGLISRTNDGLTETFYFYDNRGQLESVQSGIGTNLRRTQYVRDLNGRVLQKIMPSGEFVTFEYTPSGSLKQLITPSGSTHTFNFDIGDLVMSYLPPALAGSSGTSYEYDVGKRLSAVHMASGRNISVAYLDEGDLIKKVTTSSGSYDLSYEDAAGHVKSAKSPDLIQTDLSWVGPLKISELTHDNDGSVISDLKIGHDASTGKVSSYRIGESEQLYYAYDAFGRLIGDVGMQYDYSFTNGSEQIVGTSGAVQVVYKNTGNKTYEVRFNAKNDDAEVVNINLNRSVGSSNSTVATAGAVTYKMNGSTQNLVGTVADGYTYDLDGRLTSTSRTQSGTNGANPVTTNLNYSFPTNSNGNIGAYEVSGSMARRSVASYDAQDRLKTLSGSINRNYAYDDDGNLKSVNSCYGTTQYEYDEFSNLKKVVFPSKKTIEYKVDAQNRRVKKIVDGVTQEYYVWMDQTRLLAVLDQNKAVSILYSYGPFSHSATSMRKGGITYQMISDPGTGSIRYVVNADTARIVQQLDYDAYGNILRDSNPGFQTLAFAGGLYDRDTKLVRFGARDYDPQIGRWTTKDPIGFGGGDTNLYGYVMNDPVNFVDPSGDFAIEVGVGFLGQVGLLGGGGGKNLAFSFSFSTGQWQTGTTTSVQGNIGGGLYGGAGGQGSITPGAGSLCDLNGTSVGVGGAAGTGLAGWSGQVTVGSAGPNFSGAIPLTGAGVGVAGYGVISNTSVQVTNQGNLYNWFHHAVGF